MDQFEQQKILIFLCPEIFGNNYLNSKNEFEPQVAYTEVEEECYALHYKYGPHKVQVDFLKGLKNDGKGRARFCGKMLYPYKSTEELIISRELCVLDIEQLFEMKLVKKLTNRK